jgi:cation:H+ antiporter
MLVLYVSALAGLVLLFGGGEVLVRGAVTISRRLGLSPLLIGMTVVAGATSAPELVVSVDAALGGSPDIALGNVVGSNIVNVLAVLGISALITPIVVQPRAIRRDAAAMLTAMVALAMVATTGEVGRIAGGVFVLALIAYLAWSYHLEVTDEPPPSAERHAREGDEFGSAKTVWRAVFELAGGLAALVVGSRLLVTGATGIARDFGISEAVIGLTLVAIGTSLPEIATSIVAAVRKHPDVAVGNVLGSNLFNALAIIGVTALVHPIAVAEQMARMDVWVMVGTSAVLVAFLLVRGRIGRIAGAGLLVIYGAYVALLFGVPPIVS